MRPVSFGAQLPAETYNAGMNGKLSGLGSRYFELSDKAGDKARKAGPIGRRFWYFMSKFALDADFRETPVVSLGKRVFKIIEPPKAALLLLLYPFTIGPRLAQAAKRDPSGTEVKDILRRDMMAITIFLFLLGPMVNMLGSMLEKTTGGLKLNEKDPGELFGRLFSLSRLEKTYTVGNAQQLRAIIENGGEEGMKTALKKLKGYYSGMLGKLPDGPQVLDKLDLFETRLNEAIAAKNDPARFEKLTDDAYKILERVEGTFSRVLKHHSETKGVPWAIKKFGAAKVLPNARDFVSHYAKLKTLPAHIIGFATVVLAIGWFPVWLNDLLSRKKRMAKEAAARAQNLASFNPQLTYQALKQTSRLSTSM